MKIFLDTSAFAKRYVAERGSEKVLTLCEQADCLTVSIICLPEQFRLWRDWSGKSGSPKPIT